MDDDGRRRRPRRIPAPEAPGGSRRSKRLREQVPVAGPAPRILVSDSESVNRPSGLAGDADDDPFFIPGVVPDPPEEEGAGGLPHSVGERQNPPRAAGQRQEKTRAFLPLEQSTLSRKRGPAESAGPLGKPGPTTSVRECGSVV
jgi:hypothetical protein